MDPGTPPASQQQGATPPTTPNGACYLWTGVFNNYTQEELDQLLDLLDPLCKELVVDKEVGEENETPHLHLYLNLRQKKRLSWLHNNVCPKIHWERVRDRQACIDYCSKGEVVISKILHVSSNVGLSAAIDCLHTSGLAGVAREHPETYVRHYKGLQALQYAELIGTRRNPPQVSWYWGATGTGKSKKAILDDDGMIKDNIFILSAPNTKYGALWFDGYEGQRTLILDDFRPWWCRFDFLLRLLDVYPISVQVKGGFVNMIAEEIIITTTKNVRDTFSEFRNEEDLRQIQRRIHHEVHFVALGITEEHSA